MQPVLLLQMFLPRAFRRNPDFNTPLHCGHIQNREKAIKVNPCRKSGLKSDGGWLSKFPATPAAKSPPSVMICSNLDLVDTPESGGDVVWTAHVFYIPSTSPALWRGHCSFTIKGLNFYQLPR